MILERWLGAGQVLSVGYVGTLGHQLLIETSAPTFFTTDYDIALITTNDGSSGYNALQAQYRRTLNHGLQAQVAYTYSHSLDTSSSDYGGLGFAIFGGSKGPSNFDVRQNLDRHFHYLIPARSKPLYAGFSATGPWMASSPPGPACPSTSPVS